MIKKKVNFKTIKDMSTVVHDCWLHMSNMQSCVLPPSYYTIMIINYFKQIKKLKNRLIIIIF